MFRGSYRLFVINCGTTPMFQQLCRLFGRADKAEDPVLQTASQRLVWGDLISWHLLTAPSRSRRTRQMLARNHTLGLNGRSISGKP